LALALSNATQSPTSPTVPLLALPTNPNALVRVPTKADFDFVELEDHQSEEDDSFMETPGSVPQSNTVVHPLMAEQQAIWWPEDDYVVIKYAAVKKKRSIARRERIIAARSKVLEEIAENEKRQQVIDGLNIKLRRAVMKIGVTKTMKKNTAQRCACLIEDNHLFQLVWAILNFILIVYYSALLPYRVVSRFYASNIEVDSLVYVTFAFDIFCDLFFIADICLRSRNFLTRMNRIGSRLVRRDKVWELYKENGFWLDVLGTFFPVSLTQAVVLFSSFEYQYLVAIGSLTRLIRMRRLYEPREILEAYNERHDSRVSPATFQILQQLIRLAIGTYWIACCWFLVGRNGRRQGEGSYASWLNLQHTPLCYNTDSSMMHLLQSIYYVLVSLSTVGYGDIIPTTVFETFASLLPVIGNVVLYSQVTASVATIAASADTAEEDFTKKLI